MVLFITLPYDHIDVFFNPDELFAKLETDWHAWVNCSARDAATFSDPSEITHYWRVTVGSTGIDLEGKIHGNGTALSMDGYWSNIFALIVWLRKYLADVPTLVITPYEGASDSTPEMIELTSALSDQELDRMFAD